MASARANSRGFERADRRHVAALFEIPENHSGNPASLEVLMESEIMGTGGGKIANCFQEKSYAPILQSFFEPRHTRFFFRFRN
jgi:hypothetical protein